MHYRILVFSFLAGISLFATAGVLAEFPATFPDKEWPVVSPDVLGLEETSLIKARDYALSGKGSGCVIVQGKKVVSWGESDKLYDLKSSSKSIGGTLLGIALKDEKIALDDPAERYHPNFAVPPESNSRTGWIPGITLRMLAQQTAGFDKPDKDAKLLFEPGTAWSYSDAGPNWLAECLTCVYERDLDEVMFERVFLPIGISRNDIRWRRHAYRPEKINGILNREFGSGFHANMEAMSRIGYLYLREGKWKDETILPKSFTDGILKPEPTADGFPSYRHEGKDEFGKAAQHYAYLWWNNSDGTIPEIPRDSFWAWGLYDSLIFVVPSLDLVAVRAGESWARKPQEGHYDVLRPFFIPLVQSCESAKKRP